MMEPVHKGVHRACNRQTENFRDPAARVEPVVMGSRVPSPGPARGDSGGAADPEVGGDGDAAGSSQPCSIWSIRDRDVSATMRVAAWRTVGEKS